MASNNIAFQSSTTLIELNLWHEIGLIERIRVCGCQRGHVLFTRLQIQILIRVISEPLNIVEALWRISILRCLTAHMLSIDVVNIQHAWFVNFPVGFDSRNTIDDFKKYFKIN